jgi:hypothetical protein
MPAAWLANHVLFVAEPCEGIGGVTAAIVDIPIVIAHCWYWGSLVGGEQWRVVAAMVGGRESCCWCCRLWC